MRGSRFFSRGVGWGYDGNLRLPGGEGGESEAYFWLTNNVILRNLILQGREGLDIVTLCSFVKKLVEKYNIVIQMN